MELMTALSVYLDLENKAEEILKPHGITDYTKVLAGEILAIGALPKGMHSGKTSIGLLAIDENGKATYFQTSLKMFQMAAVAFMSKYGDETNGDTLILADLKGPETA